MHTIATKFQGGGGVRFWHPSPPNEPHCIQRPIQSPKSNWDKVLTGMEARPWVYTAYFSPVPNPSDEHGVSNTVILWRDTVVSLSHQLISKASQPLQRRLVFCVVFLGEGRGGGGEGRGGEGEERGGEGRGGRGGKGRSWN